MTTAQQLWEQLRGAETWHQRDVILAEVARIYGDGFAQNLRRQIEAAASKKADRS